MGKITALNKSTTPDKVDLSHINSVLGAANEKAQPPVGAPAEAGRLERVLGGASLCNDIRQVR